MRTRSLTLVLTLTLGVGILIGTGASGVAGAALRGSDMFRDVARGHGANDAIGRMVGLGIMRGRSDVRFEPSGTVNRGEMAVMLDRLYTAVTGNTAPSFPVSSSSSPRFSSSAAPQSSSASSGSSGVGSSSSSSTASGNTPVPIGIGAPTFFFTAAEYAVAENTERIAITVERAGDLSVSGSVDYATQDDGSSGGDFIPASGTLTFAAGETTKTFTVSVFDNTRVDGIRRATLLLDVPGSRGPTGRGSTAKLLILDNESGFLTAVSSFRFDTENISVRRDDGAVYVTVRHVDGTSAGSVTYATIDGSATAGTDYIASAATVDFAPGEAAKVIAVPLLSRSNGSRTFSLKLVGSTTQDRLSDPGTTTILVQ